MQYFFVAYIQISQILILISPPLNAVDAEIVSIDAFTKSPPKRGLVVGITFVKVQAPLK